jgi:gamma-glutamyltranspeptidase/glutathione hydrolase
MYKEARIIFIMVVLCSIAGISQVYASEPQLEKALYAESYYGAVSCGHPLAVSAALKILSEGGNAVDAAVGCAFMLGVVDFSNSGLGGDGHGVICFSNGQVVAIDGSTKKPLAVTRASASSGLASDIGLPTIPEMLLKLLRLYGTRWPSEVMAPAILACIKGFPVTSYLEKVTAQRLLSIADPNAIELLAPNGYPLRAGHILKQPQLAKTLMAMSRDGGISFYKGAEALDTIKDMQAKGSKFDLVDLASYRSKFIKPIRVSYGDYSIYGAPPPSSSLAAIEHALNLLESKVDLFPKRARDIRIIAQLGRDAINRKYYLLADAIDAPESYSHLKLGPEHKFRANPNQTPSNSNTTHLSIIDRHGMAISLTLTLGTHFGTGELAPGGYFYNNGLRNYKNGARYGDKYPENAGPISAKSPIIVTKNQKSYFVLGGSGSDRIISNTGLVLARLLSGHHPSKSVSAFRYFLDHKNRLQLEWQPDTLLTQQLEKELSPKYSLVIKPGCDDYFGMVSVVKRWENGLISTAGDQRRDGACGVLVD